jgi:hypothetical protein
MANTLDQGDRDLVNLDYNPLLAAILEYLKSTKNPHPFRVSENGKQLFIDIDEIAYNLAMSREDRTATLLSNNWKSARVATTNLSESSKDDFVNYHREIRDCLQQHLECVLQENKHSSIEEFLKSFWTELSNFQGKVGDRVSLNYDFKKQYAGLSKQQLTLKKSDGDKPLLKFHRLKIGIKKGEFDLELKESIDNYIKKEFSNNNLDDELKDVLHDFYQNREQKDSELYALKELLNQEAIAKVQRTAKIKYLEYLLEHIESDRDSILLEILIKRVQALESYLNDASKADGDYQVNYASVSCNLREIFAQANAFDSLPIIPIIEGGLGEIRDDIKGELSFIFGLKLKFAGKIQTEGGKTVLDYNLDLFNPNSEKHQEGLANQNKKESFVKNLIGRLVLYFFVFAGHNPQESGYSYDADLNYQVSEVFTEKVLPVFKDSDETKKRSIIKGMIRGIQEYKASEKLERLTSLLKSKIATVKSWNSRNYPIQINVKQGILETDPQKITNESTFFICDFRDKRKTPLKYISVTDSTIDTNYLCYLSGDIEISEISYFETANHQEFTMEYATGNFPTIPIVCYPKKHPKCVEILEQNFKQQKLILFPYQYQKLPQDIFNDKQPQPAKAFIYRFTFSLLAHISLKILLDTATKKLNRQLFIPILRLHLGDKQNPLEEEQFLIATFEVLSHLINLNHRSNTQGISIKEINIYKLRNALSSLYNVLPKKFKFEKISPEQKLKKLAIIVVSSRECDRSWQGDYKVSNLMGEVIKIDRQDDGSILVYTSKTISEHYHSRQMHSEPNAIIREVERLDRDGYQHILYIAKSPYSKTLNLTASDNDDNLYFMSSAVMRNLKGEREDLKIYPVFFDKYYAVSLGKIERKSLYIQDVEELTNLVDDPTKQVAVFFNLFNGIKVGNPEDRYYNGIISYSTLLNIYEQNILNTTDIYAGLIDNDRDRSLKPEILQLLTLFHFSRYEADSQNIQLKLDPYQNIIGEDSVGALSLFPHVKAEKQINFMAFLNEVNYALDAKLDSSN